MAVKVFRGRLGVWRTIEKKRRVVMRVELWLSRVELVSVVNTYGQLAAPGEVEY